MHNYAAAPGSAHKQFCKVESSQGKHYSDVLFHELPEWS